TLTYRDGPSGGLKHSDCLCPVCLDIFLEPVTLPCMHTFCKPCFMETVDKSNICCPLCRKRVSTWARLNNRNKTLVNVELWRRIQDAFPTQCERRVQGIDDDDDAVTIPRPRVCQPGELRKEYEDQISKVRGSGRSLCYRCVGSLANEMAGVPGFTMGPYCCAGRQQHNSFCLCVQSCSMCIMLHTNCAAVEVLKDLKSFLNCE
uniref:RING-type E3 ubiquitin transferase n=1 Tax=Sinocyclocheilus rhinocerous TaxID=307959 RepID=A0A673FWH2_9TELE